MHVFTYFRDVKFKYMNLHLKISLHKSFTIKTLYSILRTMSSVFTILIKCICNRKIHSCTLDITCITKYSFNKKMVWFSNIQNKRILGELRIPIGHLKLSKLTSFFFLHILQNYIVKNWEHIKPFKTHDKWYSKLYFHSTMEILR